MSYNEVLYKTRYDKLWVQIKPCVPITVFLHFSFLPSEVTSVPQRARCAAADLMRIFFTMEVSGLYAESLGWTLNSELSGYVLDL